MKLEKGLKKIARITLVIFVVLLFLSFFKIDFFAQILIYEVVPFYNINTNEKDNPKIAGIDNVLIKEERKENKENKNLEDFKKEFYVVDKKTGFTGELFNYNELINYDVSLNRGKILIFHTHSNEMFADSKDETEGIVMVGEELKKELEKLGIECVHITDSFDEVNGKLERTGSYERMENVIATYLKDNPDIKMTIDLHRDGVGENTRLVTNIGGKETAQVMFFNGICKIYDNGELVDTEGLYNPYVKDNLALSLQSKINADTMYPNFARKIYINAYRYSNHLLDKSMLIELGAQTNTKQEALNAVKPLAQVLFQTLN